MVRRHVDAAQVWPLDDEVEHVEQHVGEEYQGHHLHNVAAQVAFESKL
jgi:hypothetical protein